MLALREQKYLKLNAKQGYKMSKRYISKKRNKTLVADEENTIQPFLPSPHHKPKYNPNEHKTISESQDADRHNKLPHNKPQ